jgi:hypothetical protein
VTGTPSARSSFDLQRGEESLHRRIVPDVAVLAHPTDNAVIGDQALELFAGLLAAAIGMTQQRVRPELQSLLTPAHTKCRAP